MSIDTSTRPLVGPANWTRTARRLLVTMFATLALAAAVLATAPPASQAAGGCPNGYPADRFRACYYGGIRPGENFLGAVSEPRLPRPVPQRFYGIDHDWGTGEVFGGIAPAAGPGNDISAVWRGRFRFARGNYHFTFWASDGIRVRIDGRPVLNEWSVQDRRHGVAVSLREGLHTLHVSWFARGAVGRETRLRVHWDRLPDVAGAKVTRPVIDVFIVPRQDVCIAGDPWTSGPQVVVRNADGSTYRAWQVDDQRPSPVGLVPSDPSLPEYAQVECFRFGFTEKELRNVRREVKAFGQLMDDWSFGAIRPRLRVRTISGPLRLHRIVTGFWIAPSFIEHRAERYMTRDSDFAITISSNDDLRTRRYYEAFACGGALGADHGMWGTGYAWVACVDALTILHEWEHQLTWAMNNLIGFHGVYPNRAAFPSTGYPPCGQGAADIFSWFPDSEDWWVEPASPWCGLDPEAAGIAEMHLLAHFDPSLRHYPAGELIGNHCRDGVQNYEETGVDTGERCPAR